MRIKWFFALVCLLLSGALATTESAGKPEFPEPLNEDDFKTSLKSGLHIVEFYSPNCGHCKALAPTWRKTWETFYEEGKALNIAFSQVNCQLSGDLCAQEKIAYFPTIRLYGPSGLIKNFPSDIKRSMENLIDFARREAADPANAEIVDIKSTSIQLSGDKFNQLLAGKGKQPTLVSFWPSKTMKSTDEDIGFENCEDCSPFQRTWRLLSSRLLSSNITTGHINCESSATLCEELGFDDLVRIKNYSRDRVPRVALIIPGRELNNLFVYESEIPASVADYEEFALRVIKNCEAPHISANEVNGIVGKELQLPSSLDFSTPPQNLHLIFAYNPETVVPEDFAPLEYLVEPLSKLPNVYLYKSTEDMREVSQLTLSSMYQLIGDKPSGLSDTVTGEFLDKNLMGQNPCFYLFRDGEKIPHIYPGYSTTETRNVDSILSWVESLALPFVNEVTPYNFEDLLQFAPEEYSGLAIQLVNTSSFSELQRSNKFLDNFIIGAYGYEDSRMQHIVAARGVKREKKDRKVEALKKKGASARKRVTAAIQDIPHIDDNKVILGYIDISRSEGVLPKLGLAHRGDAYKAGDVIIVDKTSRFVYEHDAAGDVLTSEASDTIRDTLVSALLPNSSADKVSGHLLNTPFGDNLRILDSLHQFGFLGYLGLFSILLLAFKMQRYYKRAKISRNYKAKRNTLGILGNANKKN